MRNPTKCLIAVGLLLSVGATGWGEEISATESLIARLDWARFDVVRGRVAVRSARYVRGSQMQSSGDLLGGTRETLAVQVGPDAPTIRYERVRPEEALLVHFEQGNQLSIRRRRTEADQTLRMSYRQPAHGPITLELAVDSQTPRTWTAESFWHLMLIHAEPCRQHLLPILQDIRPDWRLLEQSRRIEENLLRIAETDWLPAEAQWTAWVDELASGDFQQRQAADRKLRSAGQAVLPFLEALDPATLDAEQRMRIQRIQAALSLARSDEPQRVAIWLNADPTVWVALLSHDRSGHRELAAARLGRLRGGHIEFDPHADPALRAQQIRQLADRLVAD